MKPNKLSLILTLLGVMALAACSHQWREASPDHSASEVLSLLDEVNSAQGQAMGGGSSMALQYREGSMLYFADAPSNLGGVASLLSFNDLGFLGAGFGLSWQNVYAARVFAFDRPSQMGSGRDIGLLVGIDQGNGFSYYGFSGQGQIDNGQFVAQMSGSGGAFELRSYDVVDGQLSDVIQFRVYQGGQFIGQFSTLVSYSQ